MLRLVAKLWLTAIVCILFTLSVYGQRHARLRTDTAYATNPFAGKKPPRSFIARWYHNLTARYNAYYLAWQKLATLQKTIKENLQPPPDPDSLLPVFPLYEPDNFSGNGSDLDYIIEKATIGVRLHPFSRWTDDNLAIIGLARYLKKDYMGAREILAYTIRHFPPPKEPSKYQLSKMNAFQKFKYKSHKWMYRRGIKHVHAYFPALFYISLAYSATEDFNRANTAINKGLGHPYLPYKWEEYLRLARVHANIKKGAYYNAAEQLKEIIPEIKNKSRRAWLYYLLGQLYHRSLYIKEAIEAYNKVLDNRPHPELAFRARLNSLSLATEHGIIAMDDIKSMIRRMLSEETDPNRKAQLYLLRARIALKENDERAYFKNLRKARDYATSNMVKAKIYAELTNYYTRRQDLLATASSLDSLLKLDPTNPIYLRWKEEHPQIKFGADEWRKANRLDTLLYLASLSQKDRIKELKKIARERERQRAQRQKKKNAVTPTTPTLMAKNAWYFYNETTVKKGKDWFDKTFGNRPLEDFWIVSNKDMLMQAFQEDADTIVIEAEEDMYIQKLLEEMPATASARRDMQNQAAMHLYNTAMVLHFLDWYEPADSLIQEALSLTDDTILLKDLALLGYINARERGHSVSALRYKKLYEKYGGIIEPPEDTLEKLYLTLLELYQNYEDSAVLELTTFVDSVLSSLKDPYGTRIAFMRAVCLCRDSMYMHAAPLLSYVVKATEDEDLRAEAQALLNKLDKLNDSKSIKEIMSDTTCSECKSKGDGKGESGDKVSDGRTSLNGETEEPGQASANQNRGPNPRNISSPVSVQRNRQPSPSVIRNLPPNLRRMNLPRNVGNGNN